MVIIKIKAKIKNQDKILDLLHNKKKNKKILFKIIIV